MRKLVHSIYNTYFQVNFFVVKEKYTKTRKISKKKLTKIVSAYNLLPPNYFLKYSFVH